MKSITNIIAIAAAGITLAQTATAQEEPVPLHHTLNLVQVNADATPRDTQHDKWIQILAVKHELSRNPATGEISEVIRIKRFTDERSPSLLQTMLDSTEIPEIIIGTTETNAEGKPICYLKYKLDRCFIKSWSTSGDADDRPTEEVAFYYNKIAFNYAKTTDGKEWESDANWFIADSFSFGVEREMKESGEKGGTEDINIGLGELQECTISKSMDAASTKLGS